MNVILELNFPELTKIVNIIFSEKNNTENKCDAIEYLINKYELPFNSVNIEGIFETLKYNYPCIPECEGWIHSYTNAIVNLLNKNKSLLISLFYAISDTNDNKLFKTLINIYQIYSVCTVRYEYYLKVAIEKNFYMTFSQVCPTENSCLFTWLQDYYKFDVTDLPIPEEHKQMICRYVNCKNVKSAKKPL